MRKLIIGSVVVGALLSAGVATALSLGATSAAAPSTGKDGTAPAARSRAGAQVARPHTALAGFTNSVLQASGVLPQQVEPGDPDTEPPVLTVPANITTSTDDGKPTAAVTFTVTATDNAGDPTITCAPASGTDFALGTTTVSCTAKDAADNTDTETFTVTVNDDEAPVVTAPANVTVGTDDGKSTAVVSYAAPINSDNVGVTETSCTPASGSTFALGTTTVTCTAKDAAGNTGSATFTVKVVDDEDPVLTVPANITIGTDTGVATAVVTFTPTATDNVGVTSIVCTPASGSTFALGDTTVSCTASDAAGNTDSGTFKVTVFDDEDPVLTVPANITTLATKLQGAVVTFTPTATDNVGVTGIVCTPASGSTFGLGDTTVSCTARDAAGNTDSGSFKVKVTVDASSTKVLLDAIAAADLPTGVSASMSAPLGQVTALLSDANKANDAGACNKLDAFVNIVGQKLQQGRITAAFARDLTAFARFMQDTLC